MVSLINLSLNLNPRARATCSERVYPVIGIMAKIKIKVKIRIEILD